MVHSQHHSYDPTMFIQAVELGENFLDSGRRFSVTFWRLDDGSDFLEIRVSFGCT